MQCKSANLRNRNMANILHTQSRLIQLQQTNYIHTYYRKRKKDISEQMEWGTKRNTQAFLGAVHKLMVLKRYVFHPASESETANEVLWTLGTTRQVLYYTQNASRHRLHSPPNLHTYIIYIVANLVPSSHRVWTHQAQPQQLVTCPLTHDEL